MFGIVCDAQQAGQHTGQLTAQGHTGRRQRIQQCRTRLSLLCDPQTFELVAQLAYLGGKSQIIEINVGEEIRPGIDPLAYTLEVTQPASAFLDEDLPPGLGQGRLHLRQRLLCRPLLQRVAHQSYDGATVVEVHYEIQRT